MLGQAQRRRPWYEVARMLGVLGDTSAQEGTAWYGTLLRTRNVSTETIVQEWRNRMQIMMILTGAIFERSIF